MSYFIFLKDLDNVEGTLYRIAENQSDLNNLNISQTIYKIIEDSQSNFNLVKFGNKSVTKYSNNVITYVDQENLFTSKEQLKNHIDNLKNQIKQFTDNNPNHPLFSRWNNYYNQLNTLNLDSITYPLNKSLEQYFNDLGQPSYNILQLA
jgi:mRNA-degrading endonuclease YafQ of YafQ-DinJ toxin-antitoxin module